MIIVIAVLPQAATGGRCQDDQCSRREWIGPEARVPGPCHLKETGWYSPEVRGPNGLAT